MDSTAMPGIKNSGLFANHELKVGVPQRTDWGVACEQSTKLLSDRGESLIKNLGFTAGRTGAHALLLTGKGPRPEAIAVMLDEDEAFDADSSRFQISPVAYGLTMAQQNGVPWLIMLRGSQVRLYPARIDLGVGRKGLSETYCEVDLPQLTKDNAGYLSLIFSATALVEGGTAHQILQSSTQYAVALGERLRDRVYDEIIPELSVAVAQALIDQDYEMDAEGLDLAYQLTLRVFFRMLFQVYAEDRKLLPYGENETYDRNAIKTLAKDLIKRDDESFDEDSTALWDDLAQVWKVIDTGNKSWGVPAYNGGLFTGDKELNPHGAILKNIAIPDVVMGPVLKALLLDDDGEGGIGPVDFRSLSVREFGTIYEGLLESSLGLAEQDLTLDKDDNWIPAKKKSDEIWAPAGSVYFHNTSGQRKGTGSYFTPSFVVEHLLERSLNPALDAHLEKVAEFLKKGDQASAAELFFDFRVADLAMGSGHFLTSAIDHIEQKMASFLAEEGHFIPGVAAEIQKLEKAAVEAIGPDAIEPDRSSLLRRQIARRCIYGLDINPIAVELARVSIWIHTFVRGLPMSSLDHNLVCANSLTGIGSVDEALDVLVPGRNGAPTFFDADIEEALVSAKKTLMDVAMLAEVSKAESQAAARAVKKAEKEAEKAKLLFDAAVLMRIGRGGLVASLDPDELARMAKKEQAQEVLQPLNPAHMPVLFPEVFLRDNGGFDVLIGNPPWEEIGVKEHKWWALRFPGIRSLSGADYKRWHENVVVSRPDLVEEFERDVEVAGYLRSVLVSGPFPGLATGSVDLYKAFSWRNVHCLRDGGEMGLVMPRGLFASTGSKEWRVHALANGSFRSVVTVVNKNQWVFPIHPQYSIVLMGYTRGVSEPHCIGPTVDNYADLKMTRRQEERLVSSELISTFTDEFAFPIIASLDDVEIMKCMMNHVRLRDILGPDGKLRVGVPAVRLRAAGMAEGYRDGRVAVLKGGSFKHWNPDLRAPENSIAKTKVPDQRRRELLESCVIAFRQIARATDSRTIIVSLLPPMSITTDGAPIVDIGSASPRFQAGLLGVLSSRIFDWYMRRWVEINVNQWLLEPAPIPDIRINSVVQSRLIEISALLASVDERFETWKTGAGITRNLELDEDKREKLLTELDAVVAHLYGLSRDQVSHLFESFGGTWKFREHLAEVLKYYDALPKVSQ
jgi:hypothetical protein